MYKTAHPLSSNGKCHGKGRRIEDKDHGECVLKANPLPETQLT